MYEMRRIRVASQMGRVTKLWERGDSGMGLLLDTHIKNTRKKKEVLAYRRAEALYSGLAKEGAVQAGYPN